MAEQIQKDSLLLRIWEPYQFQQFMVYFSVLRRNTREIYTQEKIFRDSEISQKASKRPGCKYSRHCQIPCSEILVPLEFRSEQ